ncbi:MAG: CrcB family protein [Pirellulales bacterium]|nr:CrcB family protein [Pirellulales bacterium]
MQNQLAIALGGAAGALCRYGVNVVCAGWLGAHPAWGTAAVNLVGSLALGLLAGAELGQHAVVNAAIAVGFLGAFTTFSTFSLETVRLAESGAAGLAAANAAASVVLGAGAVYAGIRLGHLMAP